MYTVNHHKKQNCLEISNTNKTVFGKIHLNQGASLQELTMLNQAIIQDLSPLNYNITYASSILFPFANRVKDGKYSFNGTDFQLEKNQIEEQNALHGFVYNKTFSIEDIQVSENSASITLEYIETKKTAGFPYTYSIRVNYIFNNDSLSVKVIIKNTDTNTFPFTLGWHPYFISDDLSKSEIVFDSDKKLIIGDRNIASGIEKIKNTETFKIENKQLDDCWILNSDKVVFQTPKYQLEFSSSAKENFLQAYTPPKENTIAIEPTTGVSDSFNNKIGLQTLEPNKEHSISWKMNINNN